jgi:hypothetical protein
MENNGINVGHLWRMQTDLIREIQESERRTGARIDALATHQAIANGRVGKLERITAGLRKQSADGSLIGSLTSAQKAKLAGIGLAVASAVGEVVHRLTPKVIGLLAKVGQP